MIDQERMEKALGYLTKTDAEFARLEAYFSELNKLEKTVAGLEYQSFKEGGKGDGEAKELAKASQEYQSHIAKVREAQEEYLVMRRRRETANTMIEVWRSLNSQLKKTQI